MVMPKVFRNVQTLFLPFNSIGGVLGEIDCVNYTKFVIGDAPYFTFYHQDYPHAIGQICHIAYCVSMIYTTGPEEFSEMEDLLKDACLDF